MWYQVKAADTREEIGTACHTIAEALTYCKMLGGEMDIVHTNDGKITATVADGWLIAGTPEALIAAEVRGIRIAEEGR